jgi:hypothetical protein
MDSDVIAFSRPGEVLDALRAVPGRFAWSKDLCDAYSLETAIIEKITGLEIPRRLCAGFLVTPRLGAPDFQFLDEMMGRLIENGNIEMSHPWSCQTYYAVIASRYPGSGCFSEHYSNTVGPTSGSAVVRHYVGIPKVRYRYFTEGIPRIRSDSLQPQC